MAYMTMLPRDPFQISSAILVNQNHWFGGYIHYEPLNNTWDVVMGEDYGPYVGFPSEMRARGIWYILVGVGPDGKMNVSGRLGAAIDRVASRTKADGVAVFYDPTNGTVSYGDIVRFEPGGGDYITW